MFRQHWLSEEWFWRKRRSGTRGRDRGFSITAVNICWEGRGTRKTMEALCRACGDLAHNVRPTCLLIQNDAFIPLESVISALHSLMRMSPWRSLTEV